MLVFAAGKNNEQITLTIQGRQITETGNTKYLGLPFDSKLTWKTHIQNTANAATGKFTKLYPLFKSHKLNKKTKILLYKAVIRVSLLYGYEVWGKAAKTHTRKLQTVQNKILRTILQPPRGTRTLELHQQSHLESVQDEMKKAINQFYNKIRTHGNPLIRRLGKYSRVDRSRLTT